MSNGWEEYQKLVLAKLDKNDVDHGKLFSMMSKIQIELATLKVKASIWGAAAGMIPVIVALAFWLLRK